MAQWSPLVEVIGTMNISHGKERDQNDGQIPHKVLDITGLRWNRVEHQESNEESEAHTDGELESTKYCI